MQSLTVKSLNDIRQNPALTRVAEAIDDLLKGHNNVASQLGTDPNGSDVIPANIAKLEVQHLGGGHIDVAITDNSKISRAIEYHIEYSQDKGFTNPRGRSLRSWRTAEFTLPNGTWFFRAFSQNPYGGPPSSPVTFPLSITISDSNDKPLFGGQASGTGRPNTGGGWGSGKVLSR